MVRMRIHRLRPSEGMIESIFDTVAEEKPLHLFLNGKYYASILSSPSKKRELTLGHLITEGLVNSVAEIEKLEMTEKDRCEVTLRKNVRVDERLSMVTPFSRVISSSCGSATAWPLSKLIDRLRLPKILLDQKFEANVILKATQRLNQLAKRFRETGGLHAAALYDHRGKLLTLAEDVGRHNALDKAIGQWLMKGRAVSADSFASTTGRLSADIVLKAVRVKIPLVASLSAPLESGVKVARLSGLTLIGFVRGPRMNVYTGLERVTLKSSATSLNSSQPSS
ncbi:MAG TPA: formate dehydrogenase accessory sulfurtransferase FdhD [Candidatus Bathyarchaeia archaeon]|nr:formate dehydrogenase accessory sulfurtransferase FdhD [Candidatus Bathyarchaeia archaeon]